MKKAIFALLIITSLIFMGCSGKTSPDPTTSTMLQITTSVSETTTTEKFVVEEMSQKLCLDNKGRWDVCGNRCLLDNQDENETDCILVCEELCECSESYGFSCPPGYECVVKSRREGNMGYCERI